ncbi:MAG: hypothetical protein Q9162_003820 [Coniocarpon cinnabarinum]
MAWPMTEFSEILDLLRAEKLSHLRVCIFVDGLDEYSGDLGDVAEIVTKLASSSSIKICASSRPRNVLFKAFIGSPMITLEDLTAGDITLYVNDKFKGHQGFERLREFAVNFEDLKRERLRELPTDLFEYFELMLNSIEKVYRSQSARIFQLCLTDATNHSVITLSHFDKDDINFALRMPSHTWSGRKLSDFENQAANRIRARCTDLLEVKPASEKDCTLQVHFLHRTVRDFLIEQDVQNLLLARLTNTLTPSEYFAASFLAQLKIIGKNAGLYKTFEALEGVLSSCFGVERTFGRCCTSVLDELHAMLLEDFVEQAFPVSRYVFSCDMIIYDNRLILRLAFDNYLDLYVQHRIRLDPQTLHFAPGMPLTVLLIGAKGRAWRGLDKIYLDEDFSWWNTANRLKAHDPMSPSFSDVGADLVANEELLRFLFENGASPNDPINPTLVQGLDPISVRGGSYTVWTYFLQNLLSLEADSLNSKVDPKAYTSKLFWIFLEYGADTVVDIPGHWTTVSRGSPFSDRLDLSEVVQWFYGERERENLDTWISGRIWQARDQHLAIAGESGFRY